MSRSVTLSGLLGQQRSPARDRRLYDLAIAQFNAIEAGREPDVTAGRRVMAQALQEARLGDLPEALPRIRPRP